MPMPMPMLPMPAHSLVNALASAATPMPDHVELLRLTAAITRVEEVLSLTNQQSADVEVDGLRWFLEVSQVSDGEGTPSHLAVVLRTRENKSTIWRADATVTFSLENLTDTAKSVEFQYTHTFDHKSTGAWAKMIEFDRLVSEAEGFLREDRLTVEARFAVNRATGIRRSTRFDFTVESDERHDVCLVVDGRRLFVGKQYLALHSPVFRAMFYGNFDEKDKKEIEIKDVNCEEFIQLLNVIYPSFHKITDANVEFLLSLGDRFQIKFVIDECERVLIASGKYTNIGKLRLADQFRLIELQDHCLGALAQTADISALQYSTEFEELSSDAKASILHHFMRLTRESQ